jgi:Domain of unknown function (DUF4779)
MLALATGYGHSKKHGKGHKGVKGHSGHKGHKGKKFGKKHEDHWAKHSNAKGKHSKGHHDSKKYHGDHHKGSKGHKGAKFGKKGHKHKGHVTKGFKNTYHKNEFSKKTKFYDSFDNGGYHKKFGGYKGHYGGSKGNKFKGGKLSGFFKGGKFGKKHHLDKGKHFDEHKGNKGYYEEKGSYGHKSEHKKGGKGYGGHGHKHGHKHHHDHGYGHSGHNPTYAKPERRSDDGTADEYDEDYGDYNGYDYALEAEQKKLLNNKKGEVDQEPEEPQEEEQEREQPPNPEARTYSAHSQQEYSNHEPIDPKEDPDRINPREFHKDYYPKEDHYKMVGGFFANHHPPTENNFDSDHNELEEKSELAFKKPKVSSYSYGNYEDDPDFENPENYAPEPKSDDRTEGGNGETEEDFFKDPRSRSSPGSDGSRRNKNNADADGDAITAAFRNEWTNNPDDEITKQVMGYFHDDRDDFPTTTKRPVFREDPIPGPPLSRSPLARIPPQPSAIPASPSKNVNMPEAYHPFSGFYYKNKFNSA